MPTFIKPGFWEKRQKGYDHWLNLDQLITSLSPTPTPTGVFDYTTTTHIVPYADPETIIRVLTIPANTFTNETWLNLAVSVINNITSVINYGGIGLYFNEEESLTGASKIGKYYTIAPLSLQDLPSSNQFQIDKLNLLIKNDTLFCSNLDGIWVASGYDTTNYINRPINLTLNNYIIITGLGSTNSFYESLLDITIESIILNKTN